MRTIGLLVAAAAVGLSTRSSSQQASLITNGSHPVISPDGRHIAFTSNRDGTNDIYLMDADGGNIVRVTNSAENEGIAGWSADSKRLVYSVIKSDTATLFAVPIGGGGAARIGWSHGQGTRITSDGTRVVYGELPYRSRSGCSASTDPPRDSSRISRATRATRSVPTGRRTVAGLPSRATSPIHRIRRPRQATWSVGNLGDERRRSGRASADSLTID